MVSTSTPASRPRAAPGDLPRTRGLQPSYIITTRRPRSALQATFPGRGDCNLAKPSPGRRPCLWLQATFPGRGDCNSLQSDARCQAASSSRRPSPDEGTATRPRVRPSAPPISRVQATFPDEGTATPPSRLGPARRRSPGDLPRTRGLQHRQRCVDVGDGVSPRSRRPSPDEGTATKKTSVDAGGSRIPASSRRPSPDEGTATR